MNKTSERKVEILKTLTILKIKRERGLRITDNRIKRSKDITKNMNKNRDGFSQDKAKHSSSRPTKTTFL